MLAINRPYPWRWIKLARNMLIACFFILATFSLKNLQLPKAYLYTCFRDFTREEFFYLTRNYNSLEGEHFVLRYLDEDKEVAPLVLAAAEEFYDPVSQALAYLPEDKILVVIYPTRESLGKSFGWQGDESAMGVYFAGVIRILSPNAWIGPGEDPVVTARIFRESGPMAHELAHLLLDYRTQGNYTRWFTEGVAQYLERQLTGFEFDDPAGSLEQPLYSLRDMDGGFDALENQALAYRQSLAAVEMILDRGGWSGLHGILDALKAGRSTNDSIKQVLGLDPREFEIQLRSWSWVRENGRWGMEQGA